MLKREGAYFTSLEAKFEEIDRSIPLSKLSKPLFEIIEIRNGNDIVNVELDRESRKYINVRMNHITKTYDASGNMTKIEKNYPLT